MINEDMLLNKNLDTDIEANNIRNKIFTLIEEYAKLSHKTKQFTPGKSFVPCSGRIYAVSYTHLTLPTIYSV